MNDFSVAPKSWDSIAQIGDEIRADFGLQDQPWFPVREFVEDVLDKQLDIICFLVGDVSEMGTAEGYTCPRGKFIELREDVYRLACKGDGRARFTTAHELGHLVLHVNIPLSRALPHQSIKPFRSAEAQANQFAAEILMPPRFFRMDDDPITVMARHGVSYEAAQNRLRYLYAKGKIKK